MIKYRFIPYKWDKRVFILEKRFLYFFWKRVAIGTKQQLTEIIISMEENEN